MNSSSETAIPTNGKTMRQGSGIPSFDLLVQNLQIDGLTPSTLGVTASAVREGVTTVAANLAITAARSQTQRVLLVDTNFARPAAIQAVRARVNRPGLLDVLAGDAEFEDCVQDTKVARLSVLAPGKRGMRKGLNDYSSSSLESLVENLKYQFGVIVFDLPPVSDTANCQKLAGLLDGVLLVVSAGGAPREQVKRASKQLNRCGGKILGVVLNKAEG